MRHARTFLFAALGTAITATAGAAGLPDVALNLPDNILSSGDFDRMHEAAARLYQHRTVGDVESWAGPDSHDAGTVRLVRSFESKGMACSRLQYDIRFAAPRDMQSYRLNWCRNATGQWMIEDYTPPA